MRDLITDSSESSNECLKQWNISSSGRALILMNDAETIKQLRINGEKLQKMLAIAMLLEALEKQLPGYKFYVKELEAKE